MITSLQVTTQNNMTKETENIIKKIVIRDIQIKILDEKMEGQIINEEIINQILKDIEDNLEK